jgi:hypothetical protein
VRSVVSSPPDGRRSYDGEEGESEHGEGDMAMPSRPGAHLVVIQPDLTLGRFTAGFDGPPGSGHADQSAERRAVGSESQVIGQLVRFGNGSADQQAPVPSGSKGRVCLRGPLVEPWPLGAIARAQALPVAGSKTRVGPHFDAVETRRSPLFTGYRQDIAKGLSLQPESQGVVATLHAVGRHPGAGHARGDGALQQGAAELRLGGEGNIAGDTGHPPPLVIRRPLLGQVEGAVDQDPALAASLAQEHGDLTIFDAAGGAGPVGQRSKYCRFTPTERVPFLTKPVSSSTSTAWSSPRCSTT